MTLAEGMMAELPTFQTKTGHCEITPDKIRLVRTGFRGWLAQLLHSDRFPNEILRDQVTLVEPHPPVTGATRAHFWVHYRDGGEPTKRIIILPGVLSGGNREFEKAKQMFQSEGLLKGSANQALDGTA